MLTKHLVLAVPWSVKVTVPTSIGRTRSPVIPLTTSCTVPSPPTATR
jgi:hypothetical protein